MLYVIHDGEGRIRQASKVYADPAGYDERLRDLGYTFIKAATATSLPPPEHWHVRNGKVRERPRMFIVVDKTIIKADGQDAAVLRGCPIQGTFSVMTGGLVIDSGTIDDAVLEVPSLVPCRMTVILDRWPFKPFTVDVEAVA
jgi:hypothetical protein